MAKNMAEGVQNMKNRVKISIDGKSFTLVGEETEEHMMQVAAYIDQKMAEIRQKANAVKVDSSVAYVLTAVNVADDYFKEKAYHAELEGRLTGLTERARGLMEQVEQLEDERRQLKEEKAQATQKEAAYEEKIKELQTQTAAKVAAHEMKIKELEEKLAASEKARTVAENKLDDYMIAMEGQQIQVYHPQKHTSNRRRR